MLTPVDCHKLCINDVTVRATTKNGILENICKITLHESSIGILKNVHVIHRKSGKRNKNRE